MTEPKTDPGVPGPPIPGPVDASALEQLINRISKRVTMMRNCTNKTPCSYCRNEADRIHEYLAELAALAAPRAPSDGVIAMSLALGRLAKLAGHADPDGISVEEAVRTIEAALTTAPRAPLEPREEELLAFIEREGYRRCDIPACNCESFHGGHAMARLTEIADALDEAGIDRNGRTILSAVQALVAARPALGPQE
jgi:hypothetical protein